MVDLGFEFHLRRLERVAIVDVDGDLVGAPFVGSIGWPQESSLETFELVRAGIRIVVQFDVGGGIELDIGKFFSNTAASGPHDVGEFSRGRVTANSVIGKALVVDGVIQRGLQLFRGMLGSKSADCSVLVC